MAGPLRRLLGFWAGIPDERGRGRTLDVEGAGSPGEPGYGQNETGGSSRESAERLAERLGIPIEIDPDPETEEPMTETNDTIQHLKDSLGDAYTEIADLEAEDSMYPIDSVTPILCRLLSVAHAAVAHAEASDRIVQAIERHNTTITDQLEQAASLQRAIVKSHFEYQD